VFPLQDNIPSRNPPVATISIIAANCLIFTAELSMPKETLFQVIKTLGIVPSQFTSGAWGANIYVTANSIWPFITSMFLHGSWMHIITNMWMLWIFGDNVEDRMGSFRFFIFYLLCGVFAAIAHIISNIDSAIPTIGASGAIAGVLGAYFLLFPRAQVIVFFPLFIFWPIYYILPAFVYLGIWFLMQFLNGSLSLLSDSEAIEYVAWWAHIGGFVSGIILHRFFIQSYRIRRKPYIDELSTRSAWAR